MILFIRKTVFRFIAKVNKVLLPSLFRKEIGALKKYEKVILEFRYWITKNSL